MSLKVQVAPDEKIILNDEFRIFDKLASVRFVVSSKALYLPVLKLVPAWGPYRMSRIPLESVRKVSVQNAIARSRLIIGLGEIAGASTSLLAELILGPTLVTVVWLLVLVLGVRTTRNALRRRALVVSLVNGAVTSAPPSRVAKTDRERIEDAYRRVLAGLRTVGISTSGGEAA